MLYLGLGMYEFKDLASIPQTLWKKLGNYALHQSNSFEVKAIRSIV